MKTSSKRVSITTVLLFVIGLLCSAVLAIVFAATPKQTAVAEDEQTNKGLTYYYDELKNSRLAQQLYNVLETMDDQGYFVDGKRDYDLSPVLTQVDLADYANGASKIPVALGAALDAFYMDHPDLFYVDVHKLRLTVGMKNGDYVAYLGTGRADNYYADNTVRNAEQVQAAVAAYNTAVDAIVTAAKAASTDVVEQIRLVNKKISETLTYSFGAYENKHNGFDYSGYVGTAYSLVEGEALCDGYSTAFKAVMDRLNIPCVLIIGAAYAGNTVSGDDVAGYEAHSWNAVEVGGLWYGVDVTWNDTENKLDKYTLVGSEFLAPTHVKSPVISSSGFELKYPVLRNLNYGVNTDKSGFTYKDEGKIGDRQFGYTEVGGNHYLTLGVSYDGKNVVQLKQESKYFTYRYKNTDGWSAWVCMPAFYDIFLEGSGYTEAEIAEFYADSCAEEYTVQEPTYDIEMMQFAVMDRLPAEGYEYTDDEMKDYALAVSIVYTSDAYMREVPAPYVVKITPNETGAIQSVEPLPITLEFSEELVKEEGKEHEPVGVSVTSQFTDIDKYIGVTDVEWDAEAKKLSFTFQPSPQYKHNLARYHFTATNLVGKDSGKAPGTASLRFERETVVCPKVYNDGRLYMKLYGQPEFVSASDESLSQFKDKDGQPIVGNQRSQLMLVVDKPTTAENTAMENAAKSKFGLSDDDIHATATFQIDLQVCGMVRQVPPGSFMQVGFPFPDGYGPEYEGVTFTVYHYTRKPNGEIDTVEEVPCVVTSYGIVATVKSFSPFMICAVDSAKVQYTGKNIFASVDGMGGKIDKCDIIKLESGSVTYTITKEAGYQIDRVLVNGEDRKASVTADGKLTLEYSDSKLTANNTVVVTFIADSVLAADAQKGIERIAAPTVVVTSADMIEAYAPAASTPTQPTTPTPEQPTAPTPEAPSADPAGGEPEGSNVGLIVGVVIAVVAVVALCGVALFFILRKKKATETAATKSTKSTKSNTNKSTATVAKATEAKPQRSTESRVQSRAAEPRAQARPTTSTTQTRPTERPQTRPTESRVQSRPTEQRTTVRPTERPTTRTATDRSARPASRTTTDRDNTKK